MLILAILLSAVLSYLLGSFNSSILVVRLLKHKDIRADQYAALFWKRLCGADPGGRPGKGHHRRAALPWHL